MERHAFTLLHDMEKSWWYRGRATVVSAVLTISGVKKQVVQVLDFGAGFGGMLCTLKKFSENIFAFEPDREAEEALRMRGYAGVFDTPTGAFSSQWDIIGLFDVLEHIEDDSAFLVDLKNALVRNGRVIFTVPAYQWLWGPLDIQSHHYRRYTKKDLVRVLEKAGYSVDFASYWNMFLFPPAAVVRLLGQKGEGGLMVPSFLDAIFTFLIRIEALLMRIGPLPFGLSIVACVSRQEPSK